MLGWCDRETTRIADIEGQNGIVCSLAQSDVVDEALHLLLIQGQVARWFIGGDELTGVIVGVDPQSGEFLRENFHDVL